ncbi:MAG: proline--tRNA ligase [Candidatus Roizmanbacteria bacterium]|nr:proline--tRNA ligase [Candidatus Roizmanbacteria bacterium]
MLYSRLFGKSIKTIAEEKIVSAQLLQQAGFISESTSGRYYFLPLGMRVQQKVIKIIKEEMDRAGGQEMVTPIFHPLSLWQETNRDKSAKYELTLLTDRRGAEFVPGGTAEEMFVDLIRKYQISYKDLPINIYQFSNKFRDEMRARGGLLRVREFIMKDAYSFHASEQDFKKEYQNMWNTYKRIFKRLDLETTAVEADNGYIGGDYCHEFDVESEIGESTYFSTEDGTYSAHEDVAVFKKEEKNVSEELKPLQTVEAKRGTTMKDGEKFHNLPLWQQIKDVLFVDEKKRFILAIIRGDLDVNEIKLRHLTGSLELRHATNEEIITILHSEPGFISPIGIKNDLDKNIKLIIVGDDSLRTIRNAYGGANKKNLDSLHMNIDRDYNLDIEGDIALAKEGYLSVNGKQKLIEKRGIEVGNIFQLGYYYSNKMKRATYTDADGQIQKYYMGCYGIGVGRTLATIVEKHHDDHGIIWPAQVAPYTVHLIGLDLQDVEIKEKVEKLYHQLLKAEIEVLYDDREEVRAGEKFATADLIGNPIRLVISKRTGDQVEWKRRSEKESKLISNTEVFEKIKSFTKN